MSINRRRAASSEISSAKKIGGHKNEEDFASLIGGNTIAGRDKSDLLDANGMKHSVKSGKKWQIFLYSLDRIQNSQYLKILAPCLESFTPDYEKYLQDRVACIEYKEEYIKEKGRIAAKSLMNNHLELLLSPNEYILAKSRLAMNTEKVKASLLEEQLRRNFLAEAIFNNEEVDFLTVRDDTFRKDGNFKVFSREDVLRVFSQELYPETSKAGHAPEDYNVPGQKTLLVYTKSNGKSKNLAELEVRNDSFTHYRQMRFNMYSADALSILTSRMESKLSKIQNNRIWLYGEACDRFTI
jgi:hypothetical protein